MRQKLLALITLFIAIFLIASLTRSIFSYKSKIRFYNELKAEHDKEKALNKKLKSDVSKSSDYFYIERQIREKLNLLQEDEVSLIIPEITPSPTPTPQVAQKPYSMWAEIFLKR